jgi:ribonucleotide reductase alpha subunit
MTVEEWLGKDNILGIDIWNRKYRFESESFDEWLDRVSDGNKELRQLIIDKKFLFGGRILSNRGLHKKGKKITYSNCYVVAPPEDNIESIFECATKLARTFSYGGGCGIDISKLSPKGAKINNAAKETTGAVSFMDLYSMVTELIGQHGRRGALMISIDCNHPDLEEFIGIKSDLNKVTKANISIRVSDDFLKAVKNKEDYNLTFTRTETGEVITKRVNAYDIFQKIAKMNWDFAEPGCLYWDRIKNWNLLSNTEEFEFAGTNPCVSGDTLILTDNGYKKIEDVVNQEINIWNGYQFSKVKPKITGRNQKMKRVSFSDGIQLSCTNYHKFILQDNSRIEANQLSVGDKLIKCNFPIIYKGKKIDDKVAYTQGFFIGDGSSESNRDRLSIKLHGKKRKVIDRLNYTNVNYCKSFDGEFLTLPYNPTLYNKEFVPDIDYDVESRLNWLSGYIDSDGTLQSEDGGISISSTRKDILIKVKYLLNTLGCNGSVSVMYEEGVKPLPQNDGSNDYELLHCQESYRLLISASNVKKLIDLGLRLSRVDMIANPNRDASRFISVVNIEDIDDCDIVYCFNEPENHSGIFNGVITAQCAEEPLPAGGSCLLGSINLSEFVNDNEFDFRDFRKAVSISVKALNEVLDEGLPLHPLKEQRDSVRDWRQIGLGVFGLADMLIKLGITYGSPESLELCDDIGLTMINTAIETSSKLAKQYGSYPKYNYDNVSSTDFYKINTDDCTNMHVKTYGLRNSQLLTIAPTGTLSTMLGVSGGIEPIFANYYERTTKSLHDKDVVYKVYTPIVQKYMKDHNLKDDSKLPEFFITAQNLNYKNRIDMQATWQKHIDASISSTVNVPNDFTVEDTEDLYLYAWEKGLKGITIFRDGCKRLAILNTSPSKSNESNDEEKSRGLQRGDIIEVSDDVVGKKRKLMTGCGSLHCTAFFDPITGDLLETYLSKGSTGGCNNFMIGLSRIISLSARSGCAIETIVDQLKSCGVCPSYAVRSATKKDTSKGSCCPIAIANALLDMYNEMQDEIGNSTRYNDMDIKTEVEDADKPVKVKNPCPSCGEELTFEGGCNVCKACGWSKCS